jgi:hypothetical protein
MNDQEILGRDSAGGLRWSRDRSLHRCTGFYPTISGVALGDELSPLATLAVSLLVDHHPEEDDRLWFNGVSSGLSIENPRS